MSHDHVYHLSSRDVYKVQPNVSVCEQKLLHFQLWATASWIWSWNRRTACRSDYSREEVLPLWHNNRRFKPGPEPRSQSAARSWLALLKADKGQSGVALEISAGGGRKSPSKPLRKLTEVFEVHSLKDEGWSGRRCRLASHLLFMKLVLQTETEMRLADGHEAHFLIVGLLMFSAVAVTPLWKSTDQSEEARCKHMQTLGSSPSAHFCVNVFSVSILPMSGVALWHKLTSYWANELVMRPWRELGLLCAHRREKDPEQPFVQIGQTCDWNDKMVGVASRNASLPLVTVHSCKIVVPCFVSCFLFPSFLFFFHFVFHSLLSFLSSSVLQLFLFFPRRFFSYFLSPYFFPSTLPFTWPSSPPYI